MYGVKFGWVNCDSFFFVFLFFKKGLFICMFFFGLFCCCFSNVMCDVYCVVWLDWEKIGMIWVWIILGIGVKVWVMFWYVLLCFFLMMRLDGMCEVLGVVKIFCRLGWGLEVSLWFIIWGVENFELLICWWE